LKIKRKHNGKVFVEFQEEEDPGFDFSWLALSIFLLMAAVFFYK